MQEQITRHYDPKSHRLIEVKCGSFVSLISVIAPKQMDYTE